MLYAVINIDIADSRKANDRAELQKKISRYIASVNREYVSSLAAPITLTLGDEWQTVMSEPSEAYNLIHAFQQMFWKDNINLYAGIGIGTLDTDVSSDTRKMDGPCFSYARKALTMAKMDDRTKKHTHSTKNRVFFYTDDLVSDLSSVDGHIAEAAAALDTQTGKAISTGFIPCISQFGEAINSLIENTEVIKARMTVRQRSLINDYERAGSYRRLIKASNGRYNSIGNISTMLNNSEYYVMKHNLKIIKAMIDCYCRLRGEI